MSGISIACTSLCSSKPRNLHGYTVSLKNQSLCQRCVASIFLCRQPFHSLAGYLHLADFTSLALPQLGPPWTPTPTSPETSGFLV